VGYALQDFIINLLDECPKVGITDISETIPEIAWHEGGNKTVEDTLTRAVETGAHTFGQKPALILILLPGNGKQSQPPLVSLSLRLIQLLHNLG